MAPGPGCPGCPAISGCFRAEPFQAALRDPAADVVTGGTAAESAGASVSEGFSMVLKRTHA